MYNSIFTLEYIVIMNSISTPSYAIHFNDMAVESLNMHLGTSNYSKIFILVDENSRQFCLPYLMSIIEGGYTYDLIEIKEGEINKNITTCTYIWETMSRLDADRKSVMINLGGGVITDLGGFVASTYKRGINFINIPTTLLAMVDASIGGKTGIDLGTLKNQIGVIENPTMILVITAFLKTLEKRQLNSGFAEMLKHGLIADKIYWEELKTVASFKEIDQLIYTSITIKNAVVVKDPTEQNIRKTLNYGHTLGHAIESYFLESKERKLLLHGEAIAIGMILEAFLSYKLTGLPFSELEAIKKTFLNRYKKVDFSEKDIENILLLLKYDKKNSHGNINFVLLKCIAETAIDIKVPYNLFTKAFYYYDG